jgi:hypothetical protein
MNFVVFVLASYALSSIMVEQGVFEGTRNKVLAWSDGSNRWYVRKIGKLLRCMFCTGFWVGLFLSYVMTTTLTPLVIFVSGLVAAATTYMIHVAVCCLERLAGDHLGPPGA